MGIKLVKFPSAYRIALGSEENLALKYGRKSYVVGEQALTNYQLAEWLETVDELIEMYPLFINFVEKEYSTKIGGISIPLELWHQFKNNETRSKVLKALKDYIVKSNYTIKPYPQGLVIFRYLKATGKVKGGKALVLDGGFKTLNTSITDGKTLYYVKSFYDELGMKTLITKIFKEEIKKIHPEVPSNYSILNRYFVLGEIPTGFSGINVQREKRKAIKMFVEVLFARLKRELSKVSTTYDSIVITGGLSHYLKPEWFNTDKEVYITKEEGEFANAVAMHYFRKTSVIDLGFGDVKVCIEDGEPGSRSCTP